MRSDTVQLVDDYSGLSTAADCWRKYLHKYIERLVPIGEDAPYLHAGSIGHEVFRFWYTEAWDLEAGLALAEELWGDYVPKGRHSYLTLEHFKLVLEDYFEDRSKSPTALETAESMESREGAEKAVVFDWKRGDESLLVGGIPDLPTEFANQHYIVDNKFTTGWLNDQWAQKFRITHQFRLYCAILRGLTGVQYDGAYVNAVYIGSPPKSGWGKVKSVPNKLLPPFHYTEEQLDETWEWVKGLQETRKLYEELGIWPQNEMACSNYGGCEYLPLCERTPQLRPAIKRAQYQIQPAEGRLVSGADS